VLVRFVEQDLADSFQSDARRFDDRYRFFSISAF